MVSHRIKAAPRQQQPYTPTLTDLLLAIHFNHQGDKQDEARGAGNPGSLACTSRNRFLFEGLWGLEGFKLPSQNRCTS